MRPVAGVFTLGAPAAGIQGGPLCTYHVLDSCLGGLGPGRPRAMPVALLLVLFPDPIEVLTLCSVTLD